MPDPDDIKDFVRQETAASISVVFFLLGIATVSFALGYLAGRFL